MGNSLQRIFDLVKTAFRRENRRLERGVTPCQRRAPHLTKWRDERTLESYLRDILNQQLKNQTYHQTKYLEPEYRNRTT